VSNSDNLIVDAVIDVSIVLTTYKFRAYLRAAVESLLAQVTKLSLEIIVVDDASPEADLEVIADLHDARIVRIRNEKNLGAAVSITNAIRMSRGRLLARFDGDDVWLPNAIEDLANALDQNPQANVAYGDIQTISANNELGELIRVRAPDRFELDVLQRQNNLVRHEFENLLIRHFTCAPAMMFRKSIWEKVLPWPEQFSGGLGDWYFNLRFAQSAPFVYVPKLLAYYRIHKQAMHHQYSLSNVGEVNTRFVLSEFASAADPKRLGITQKQLLALHLTTVASSYTGLGRVQESRRVLREIAGLDFGRLFKAPLWPSGIGLLLLGRYYERLKEWIKPRALKS
jgi:glycosyltransferase involved in cell wall biosynthesis